MRLEVKEICGVVVVSVYDEEGRLVAREVVALAGR
jgi:hypothetical protein